MDVAGKTPPADTGNSRTANALRQANPSKAGAVPAAVTGADKVVLSPRAREILDSRRAAAALPEIRQDLVQRVRNDFASGTYVVQQDRIAVRMMHESLLNRLV